MFPPYIKNEASVSHASLRYVICEMGGAISIPLRPVAGGILTIHKLFKSFINFVL